MSDAWVAPNRLDVVQRVNAAYPGLIHNSHAFTERVACELRRDDPKWGRNGKRGNTSDLSDDVVAWQNAAVPWGCSIVDIIGGAGGPNPTPAWIDQTRATAADGTVGAWVDVSCSDAPTPEPGPEPTPEPPVIPPVVDTALLRQIDSKLDAVLAHLVAAAQQQASDTQRLADQQDADTAKIGTWMVEQAQGVVQSVTGDLTPKIERECRLGGVSLRG